MIGGSYSLCLLTWILVLVAKYFLYFPLSVVSIICFLAHLGHFSMLLRKEDLGDWKYYRGR